MTTNQGTHYYEYDDTFQLTAVDYPENHPFHYTEFHYDPLRL